MSGKKRLTVVILLTVFIIGLFQNNSIEAKAVENITRLLTKKNVVSKLPFKQVNQTFDLYKKGNDIYLFAMQQGAVNANTPILSLYKLERGAFAFQSYITLPNGGHGDSLAVEGEHIWIVGTKSSGGILVPVVKRLSFFFGVYKSNNTTINIKDQKIIKNLVYNVIPDKVTNKNLKKAFIAVTGTKLCIKISFNGVGGSGGYYRVYSLEDLNKALNKLDKGGELALSTASVGTSAKLATFYCKIDGFQAMDIDEEYLYATKGGSQQLHKIVKVKYSEEVKGSSKASNIQKISSTQFLSNITLYRNLNDNGNNLEAEGIVRLKSALGSFNAGTYVLPGEFGENKNNEANLYFVTSKAK